MSFVNCDAVLADVLMRSHLHPSIISIACGSPNYVSPEVLDSDGYDGRKSDIWTLGVILYVLATGRLPFDAKNTTDLFDSIQKASFSFPSDVSPSFKDLVSKILVPNPKERLTLSQIKQHPWYRSNQEVN